MGTTRFGDSLQHLAASLPVLRETQFTILNAKNHRIQFFLSEINFGTEVMAAQTALTPSVSWAQRPKIIFLTINVSDVENPEIKVIISAEKL